MSLLASALLSKANIYSWRGDIFLSIETYEQCLELETYIEPLILGSTYSNLGAVHYESGNFSKGEKLVRKSIEVFGQDGKPVNLSIAHCHLAIIYLQTENIELAAHETKVSINYANMGDYRRGKAEGKILQAEIAAHKRELS